MNFKVEKNGELGEKERGRETRERMKIKTSEGEKEKETQLIPKRQKGLRCASLLHLPAIDWTHGRAGPQKHIRGHAHGHGHKDTDVRREILPSAFLLLLLCLSR